MGTAVLAILVANSPVAPAYFAALHANIGPMSALHWINDGLMAVFFLLVGLEIKREFIDGELATTRLRVLPGLAALGGMVVPALVYLLVNQGDAESLRGWAIPSGVGAEQWLAATTVGVGLGLALGKLIGVFGTSWLAIRVGWAAMPGRASMTQLLGTALLCGIGFTMSLFIGMLAFPAHPELQDEVKLGILAGSVVAGFAGGLVLRFAATPDSGSQPA